MRAANDPEPVRTGAEKARLGWTGTTSVARTVFPPRSFGRHCVIRQLPAKRRACARW